MDGDAVTLIIMGPLIRVETACGNAMVNVARIRELHHGANELVVVLHSGTRLPVSRRRRDALDRLLGAPG